MRHGQISYVPAINALERLHAELGGKIRDNKREARRLAKDMRHVEAVIKMLRPNYNVAGIAAKRRNKKLAPYKRGAGTRLIMGVLRASLEPLTSAQVAEGMLRMAGVAEPTKQQIRDMRASAHATLRRYQGRTVDVVGEGIPTRWRLRA